MTDINLYQNLSELVTRLRDDLNDKELVLLYAHNRIGKTRLSMEFKDRGKKKNDGKPNTLYFNAFTEDLFTWKNDASRGLKVNHRSKFFDAFGSLALEPTIARYLSRYADFDFNFEYEEVKEGRETFSKLHFVKFSKGGEENIKISRGEEVLFIWCIFMAICELVLVGHESYRWVEYIYIDDPISSLDDDNAISVACDLGEFLRRVTNAKDKDGTPNPMKVVVSSHHALFFNVMCNEIRRAKENEPKIEYKRYFLHRPYGGVRYTLRSTEDTPYFHHVAALSELQRAANPDDTGTTLYTFHFNALRSIMEKTAAFFGHSKIDFCIKIMSADEDRRLFNRALHLLSHGGYVMNEPTPMGEDSQDLFRKILDQFINHFQFDLPEILSEKKEG